MLTEQEIFIALISFVATLIGSMGGGGSSLIASPVFLMLGFPLPVVIGSGMVSGILWSLIASRNYLRGHTMDWQLAGSLTGCGLIGAYFGTKAMLAFDPDVLKRVLGVVIIALVCLYHFKKSFGIGPGPVRYNKFITGLFAVPLGFYEASFGSGNGIFTSAILTTARGFTMLEALGYYYLIASVWCVFAACIYISTGNYSLKLIVPAICGSVIGATIGSRLGKKYGPAFVKPIFVGVGTILGLKLLL